MPGELEQLEWWPYKNDSGEEIPAFGVIRVTDGALRQVNGAPQAGEWELTGKKPNTFGAQYSHFINQPVAVGIDNRGICCRGHMMAALFDSGDGTPAQGECWGPRNGSWKLRKNTFGFRIVAVTNSDLSIVTVIPDPFILLRGTADAAIAAGVTGSVTIQYRSSATAFTSTGVTVTCLNDLSGDITINSLVRAKYEPYMVAGVFTEGWSIYQAGCA